MVVLFDTLKLAERLRAALVTREYLDLRLNETRASLISEMYRAMIAQSAVLLGAMAALIHFLR